MILGLLVSQCHEIFGDEADAFLRAADRFQRRHFVLSF